MQNSQSSRGPIHRGEHRKKILIISDDSQLAQSLSLFFGEEFDVSTVEHFDDVLRLISQKRADLLLVDFGLPDAKISESLGSLKRQGLTIPIVLMYAYHERKKSVESEIRKYADAVFYKPVNIFEVLGQIRIFLS